MNKDIIMCKKDYDMYRDINLLNRWKIVKVTSDRKIYFEIRVNDIKEVEVYDLSYVVKALYSGDIKFYITFLDKLKKEEKHFKEILGVDCTLKELKDKNEAIKIEIIAFDGESVMYNNNEVDTLGEMEDRMVAGTYISNLSSLISPQTRFGWV